MPHINTFEAHGLYRKFSGHVSGEEILESNFQLHRHPCFRKIRYVINDFSDISSDSIEIDHTAAYATSDRIIAHAKGSLRVALVVTQPSHHDLARHYREMMQGTHFSCEIFDQLAAAREWV